ncbi:P-loop containing nucleoside triphosphate hydrolase protein [Pilatotrama ljubarskyi]|nr:P-loop containing nucleoside triphosphate hydrolase protein [Pilatotrama ljubarskyi]
MSPRRQRSQNGPPTWTPHPRESASHAPRPRLTAEDVQSLAAKMREEFKWESDPRDFQLEGVRAQIEGQDIIIQAPTGAGKTALAAGPHVWPGNERKFTLMVCPLLSLEEEMVHTFKTDFGLEAVALNSKNGACSPLVIRDILAMKYQIILLSPEMLQSRTFMNRVLRNSSFMRNIISMFIDEAHCIAHWGADFRKKYGSLGKIRAFLPRGTPVIAVTATLTARVRRTIHIVRACEHPLNTYADLEFVIPPSTSLRGASDIPKTYIYIDNIATGAEVIDYLAGRLEQHMAQHPGCHITPGVIRPFNATLSHEYRSLAMAHFRAGSIRILVCTDAAGMGCNIPDIDRVVQWKLPATMSNFIQRAGRAARGRNRTGLAVLLVERSVYNTDLVSEVEPGTSSNKKSGRGKAARAREAKPRGKKEVREYALAHGIARGGSKKLDAPPCGLPPRIDAEAADEGLASFAQSVTCRRKVWAHIFESPTGEPTVPCCDICCPSLFDVTRPASLPPEKRKQKPKCGLPDLTAQRKLQEWREMIFVRDHAWAQYDETAILNDEMIAALTSCGPLAPRQIADILEDKWAFWDEYHEELKSFIAALKLAFHPLPKKATADNAATPAADGSPNPPAPESANTASGSLKRAREDMHAKSIPHGTASDTTLSPNPEAHGLSLENYLPLKRARGLGSESLASSSTGIQVASPAYLESAAQPSVMYSQALHLPVLGSSPAPSNISDIYYRTSLVHHNAVQPQTGATPPTLLTTTSARQPPTYPGTGSPAMPATPVRMNYREQGVPYSTPLPTTFGTAPPTSFHPNLSTSTPVAHYPAPARHDSYPYAAPAAHTPFAGASTNPTTHAYYSAPPIRKTYNWYATPPRMTPSLVPPMHMPQPAPIPSSSYRVPPSRSPDPYHSQAQSRMMSLQAPLPPSTPHYATYPSKNAHNVAPMYLSSTSGASNPAQPEYRPLPHSTGDSRGLPASYPLHFARPPSRRQDPPA